MKRFRKIYLEITNTCNLSCSFCPKTKRKPGILSEEQFKLLLSKLQPYTDYLYFHLMGEPLTHPKLDKFLTLAGDAGFRVILTTNGTLLPKMESALIDSELHKINISLHAFEANDLSMPFDQYLDGCLDFGVHMKGKSIVCYRLWNQGGKDQLNQEILYKLHDRFPGEWIKEPRGTRIADRTYLEYGDKFDWPDLSACDGGDRVFCYGLKDQLGILCDGTVVPCCLDHEGDIALGNLFDQGLDEILKSPKATAIFDGFRSGYATEELCRRCGYARRFKK